MTKLRLKKINPDVKFEVFKYVLAFVMVTIIASVLISFQGEEPSKALSAIVKGALGNSYAIGNTIRWTIPCILSGMAAVVAFKSGVMNLGIEGQLYFGAFAAGVVGYIIELPPLLHIISCIVAAGIFGLLYSVIPAILKLYFQVNEMITTLMLNYIAILLTELFTVWVMGATAGVNPDLLATPPIYASAKLPVLIKGTQGNAGIFIALAVVIIVFLIYKYTIKGYELKQVGENLKFSKVGGVNVAKTFVSIFLISGFIAGICGGVEVLGTHGKFTSRFSSNLGWDGIMIAMVAKNNPFGVLGISILWGILKCGSMAMERVTNTNRLTVSLIQALFVLFVTVDYKKIAGMLRDKFGKKKLELSGEVK